MLFVIALLGLLPASVPHAQEPGAATRSALAPPAVSRSGDPEAVKLFAAAVEVQTPGGRAPLIRDFQADLTVEFYDHDEKGAHASTKSGSVTEFWKAKGSGDLYLRILRAQKTTHLCANTKGYFIWEQDGRPRDLTLPELKDDLKQLQDELHRTRELLSLFFLVNLGSEGTSLSTEKTLEMPLESGGKIEVVMLKRTKAGEPDLRLVIGRKDFRLYGVERSPAKPTDPAERFRFEAHQPRTWIDDAKKERQCLVPTIVRFFQNDREILRAAARSANDLKFNSGLGDKIFDLPR